MNRFLPCAFPGALAGILAACVLAGCPASVETDKDRSTDQTAALGEAEMKQAVAAALANHDTLDRTTQLVDLMHQLDAGNLTGAMAAYDQAARGIDGRDVALFANAWARLDAEAAIDRFLTFKNPAAQFQAVDEVIFYRARSGDAKRVREYAEKAIQGKASLSAADKATAGRIILDAAARGLAAAGQYDELTKLLETQPSDRSRGFLITKSLIELGRNEGDARKWAEGISWEAPNQIKKDVLRPVLALMAGGDGRQAGAWYDSMRDHLAPGEWLGDISNAWARNEPVPAVEWLLSQPESDERGMALRTAAYTLLQSDGPAGSEWIKARLDQPDVHAHMLFPLVQYIMSVDIQEALPLAQEIEGNGDKVSALKQILMIWSRTDYDAVKQYIAKVGVPTEVEEAVRGHNAIRLERRKAKEAAAKAAGQG